MKTSYKRNNRAGILELDYLLTIAVTFPISVAFLVLLIYGTRAMFFFSSVTLGWIF